MFFKKIPSQKSVRDDYTFESRDQRGCGWSRYCRAGIDRKVIEMRLTEPRNGASGLSCNFTCRRLVVLINRRNRRRRRQMDAGDRQSSIFDDMNFSLMYGTLTPLGAASNDCASQLR